MKIKIFILYFWLLIPFNGVCQPTATCLIGKTNIIIVKGEILYVIPDHSTENLEPLVFPAHYKIAYQTINLPNEPLFENEDALLSYLQNIKNISLTPSDQLLFLRCSALYKIWQSIGIIKTKVDVDEHLRYLSQGKNDNIAQIAHSILLIH
ncbi:MAG: hypothetical protein RBS07_17200 [Lentimicrobium sp.]|jgi:hypothetical protein|nr:hypothetical protein [Lentimicrobium sp.]